MSWLSVIPLQGSQNQPLLIVLFAWTCNGMRRELPLLAYKNLGEKKAKSKQITMLALLLEHKFVARLIIMVVSYGSTSTLLLMKLGA
jgi:hypothetical protein